jgi:hypothetical protein
MPPKSESGSRPPSRQMSQQVEISILITAFRGDPLPNLERTPSSDRSDKADDDGGAEEEGKQEEETEEQTPPPSLEELECRY